MLNVLEQEEQKALVTRCHMEGIYIVSTENSLQFPINAILDILKPFLKINQLEIIKKKLQLLMSKLTNKRYSQGMKKVILIYSFLNINCILSLKDVTVE